MSEQSIRPGRILHPAGDGVVFGSDSLGSLSSLIERTERRRPFFITTPSVARAGLTATAKERGSIEPVGEFAESRAHTPATVVLAAAEAARVAGADCLVSIGGSSVVDLTKAVALVLARGPAAVQGTPGEGSPERSRQEIHPHIALPTTLSGAEYTSSAGVTDPATGVKRGYADPGLAPKWVILDPKITLATPSALWASTGMKVLADTLETLCSPRATPLSDAVALAAFGILSENLVPSTIEDGNIDARLSCQLAVGMALSYASGVGPGLVAALRHQLGPRHGIAHGIASTIVLPHVLRWNMPMCDDALTRAARVIGVDDADALIDHIERMTVALHLPTRLGEVGVDDASIHAAVDAVLSDPAIARNSREVTGPADIRTVLDAAL